MRTRYVLTRRGLVEKGRAARRRRGAAGVASRARADRSTRADRPRERAPGCRRGRLGRRPRDPLEPRPTAPARMLVESRPPRASRYGWTVQGPAALEDTDFTAKLDLAGLPAGQRIFYRVRFLDLGDLDDAASEPVAGSFGTPRRRARGNVRFVWSGDTRRPGLGHQPRLGRLPIYEAMRAGPARLLHPLGRHDLRRRPPPAEVDAAGRHACGRTSPPRPRARSPRRWPSSAATTPTTCWTTNLRRFNAEVPSFAQWDDHEVLNNWYWEKLLSERRPLQGEASVDRSRPAPARVPRLPADAARPVRARRASTAASAMARRSRSSGSTCAPTAARTARTCRRAQSHDTAFLGPAQIAWLKQRLLASDATWKVIAADMPLGLIVYDDREDGRAARPSPRATTARRAAASWSSPTCCRSSTATRSGTSSG